MRRRVWFVFMEREGSSRLDVDAVDWIGLDSRRLFVVVGERKNFDKEGWEQDRAYDTRSILDTRRMDEVA